MSWVDVTFCRWCFQPVPLTGDRQCPACAAHYALVAQRPEITARMLVEVVKNGR